MRPVALLVLLAARQAVAFRPLPGARLTARPTHIRNADDAASAGAAASAGLDRAALRRRVRAVRHDEEERAALAGLTEAWVLTFGENGGGIHSLETLDGLNTVLVFELVDEARRFALLLEANGFFSPQPHKVTPQEMFDFEAGAGEGVRLQLVRPGSGLVPPDQRKDALEYEPETDATPGPGLRVTRADVDALDRLFGDSGDEGEA